MSESSDHRSGSQSPQNGPLAKPHPAVPIPQQRLSYETPQARLLKKIKLMRENAAATKSMSATKGETSNAEHSSGVFQGAATKAATPSAMALQEPSNVAKKRKLPTEDSGPTKTAPVNNSVNAADLEAATILSGMANPSIASPLPTKIPKLQHHAAVVAQSVRNTKNIAMPNTPARYGGPTVVQGVNNARIIASPIHSVRYPGSTTTQDGSKPRIIASPIASVRNPGPGIAQGVNNPRIITSPIQSVRYPGSTTTQDGSKPRIIASPIASVRNPGAFMNQGANNPRIIASPIQSIRYPGSSTAQDGSKPRIIATPIASVRNPGPFVAQDFNQSGVILGPIVPGPTIRDYGQLDVYGRPARAPATARKVSGARNAVAAPPKTTAAERRREKYDATNNLPAVSAYGHVSGPPSFPMSVSSDDSAHEGPVAATKSAAERLVPVSRRVAPKKPANINTGAGENTGNGPVTGSSALSAAASPLFSASSGKTNATAATIDSAPANPLVSRRRRAATTGPAVVFCSPSPEPIPLPTPGVLPAGRFGDDGNDRLPCGLDKYIGEEEYESRVRRGYNRAMLVKLALGRKLGN